jgi:hypothetical protein
VGDPKRADLDSSGCAELFLSSCLHPSKPSGQRHFDMKNQKAPEEKGRQELVRESAGLEYK